MDNVNYTWDANGNLLSDGTNAYTYDPANRMSSVVQGNNSYTFSYNGLGDRLQQTVNGHTTNYALDLNAGLTQVLDDGTNTYTYGVDRISQQHGTMAEYYLGDALGSVRQLTDANDAITLTKSYDPYGNVISSAGSSTSIFGYTGEQADSYIKLINLRSRLYSPETGRYLTKDSWQGDYNRPMSLNDWNYVEGNPVNYTDPSGQICLDPWAPTGIHFDPTRGCGYPKGSTGKFWWRRDPLGPDTAIIDMPWVDEQSTERWKQYPNSCGASALYMYLKGEGIPVDFDTLVQQLRKERPGGYDGYCCSNGWGVFPIPTPDPLKWCNKACVSAETLADVARKYYGLNIISGDNWTHEEVYRKVSSGHPVLTLVRSELSTTNFGHFVVVRGFIDRGWTVVFNDSYPGEAYWDDNGGSSEIRQKVGEGRKADWDDFDASWKSGVDPMDSLSPSGGHVRWAMSVR